MLLELIVHEKTVSLWTTPKRDEDQISREQTGDIFFLFLPSNKAQYFMQTVFKEIICMTCQALFSWKNISKCHLLKYLPSMQNVKEPNKICSR